MPAEFQIFGDGRTFRFRLKAGNGETILISQSYSSVDAAKNGIEAVRLCASDDVCFQRKKASDGSRYFRLVAKNHRVVGMSEMYRSVSGVKSGIKSVQRNAVDAPIVELEQPPFHPGKISHAKRIGNRAFVAPFAKVATARKLSGVLKLNTEQVRGYVLGQAALAQIVLDIDAFEYDPSTLTAASILKVLDRVRQLVEAHPNEVDQIFRLAAEKGGYVPEMRNVLDDLGFGEGLELEPVMGATMLLSLSGSSMCGSNGPLGPYPGDPNYPEPPGEDEPPEDDDDEDDDEDDDGSG